MANTSHLGTIAALAALSLGCQVESSPLSETAVASGALAGVVDGEVAAYLGVPYAAPPVGELRWRPPAPAEPWSGVRQAHSFGANCIQKPFPNGISEGTPWTPEYNVDPKAEFTEQDRAIAKTMASYWSNFVKTGDPNGFGLAEWPTLDLAGKQIMELDDTFQARPIVAPERLELFEAHASREP